MTRTTLAIALLATLTACATVANDDEPAPDDTDPVAIEFPTDRYSDDEIANQIGAEHTGSGYYMLGTCEGLLLNGQGTVATYADAGDIVATNPTRTIGFKITGTDQHTCHAAYTQALADM